MCDCLGRLIRVGDLIQSRLSSEVIERTLIEPSTNLEFASDYLDHGVLALGCSLYDERPREVVALPLEDPDVGESCVDMLNSSIC